MDDAVFVTRAKSLLKYKVIEQNFNIDQTTGLRNDRTIVLYSGKIKKTLLRSIEVS